MHAPQFQYAVIFLTAGKQVQAADIAGASFDIALIAGYAAQGGGPLVLEYDRQKTASGNLLIRRRKDMAKPALYNTAELITQLCALLIGREPEAIELESHMKLFIKRGRKLDSVILVILHSPERVALLKASSFYVPGRISDWEAFLCSLAPYVKDRRVLGIVMQECLIADHQYQLALDIFKDAMIFNAGYHAFRMLRLASKVNFLDYHYIINSVFSEYWLQFPDPATNGKCMYEQISGNGLALDCAMLDKLFNNDVLQAYGYAEDIYRGNFYTNDEIAARIAAAMQMAHMPEEALGQDKKYPGNDLLRESALPGRHGFT